MISCYTDLDVDIHSIYIHALSFFACSTRPEFSSFIFYLFTFFLNFICSLPALRAPAFPALPLALRHVSNMIPTYFMPKSSYVCGDSSLDFFFKYEY